MKLHHLRDVVAIAERGGLRAASRHLELAQAALTRSLGELERELGVPLFTRHARGMSLTTAGLSFVPRAKAILNDLRQARDEVDQLRDGTGGHVAVGLSIAAHMRLLPRALAPFRARFPSVRLRISEGTMPMHEAALRTGEVDFYVGPAPGRALPTELVSEDLFENTRTVLCRIGHPLAGSTSLADLVGADWATTSITARAEEEFEELFHSHGLRPPRLVVQSQSALTLVTVLAHSDLLAMAPVQWTSFAEASGSLREIRVVERLPAPTIVLVRRGALPLTPAATFFMDLLRRSAPRGAGEVPS